MILVSKKKWRSFSTLIPNSSSQIQQIRLPNKYREKYPLQKNVPVFLECFQEEISHPPTIPRQEGFIEHTSPHGTEVHRSNSNQSESTWHKWQFKAYKKVPYIQSSIESLDTEYVTVKANCIHPAQIKSEPKKEIPDV